MPVCWAPDCNHNDEKDGCKFYPFPLEDEEINKWRGLAQCHVPSEGALLCSCHFPDNYRQTNQPLETIGRDLFTSLPREDPALGQEIQVPTVTSFTSCLSNNGNNNKRFDYIDWEEYFMATALLAAKRSKDPVTQVGACIVNKHQIVVSIGYNGMPNGCHDDVFPWSKSPDLLQSKHAYVCHAELNAVLNTNCCDLSDCAMYVVLFPCNECAKVIIQARIKKLVYLSDKHAEKVTTIAAKRMLQAAGVDFRPFRPRREQLVIEFNIP